MHGLTTDSLGLAPVLGNNSKDTRSMWGGTELSGFRARDGGAAFSHIQLAEAIVPLRSMPPVGTSRYHI